MEDNCFLGLDPEGSSIGDAQTEINNFQTKLKESWVIFNELNLRVHEIIDTFLTEPGSETYTTDANFIKSKSDEEEQKYKKINKALKNKRDEVNKKVEDLIHRKKGTGTHNSRTPQCSASTTSSRSSSPKYYQAEWLRPKTLHFDESELEDIDRHLDKVKKWMDYVFPNGVIEESQYITDLLSTLDDRFQYAVSDF